MTWREFRSLLSGIGPDTPLARVVQIRLENDKEVLKNFTASQRRIRDKWRARKAPANKYSKEDMNNIITQFQEAFASW